jgi:hypothetical protein
VLPEGRSPFAVVACVWRVADGRLPEIEAATGEAIGSGFPYAAEGWDAELNALGWIDDVLGDVGGAFDFNHATSESLRNMLALYGVESIVRLGDWPRLEFINDPDRIMDAVLSRSPLGGSERPNRHGFDETVTPSIAPSWKAAVSSFLTFISFVPEWCDQAESFLDAVPRHFDVHLHAFDKNHFFYAVHQARSHPEAMLSYFFIDVLLDGDLVTRMVGTYRWDGVTCPEDALGAMETVFGSTRWATLSIGSAVDERRYDAAMPLHGFHPEVDVFVSEEDAIERGEVGIYDLHAFVETNPAYALRVSQLLERMGPLPTDPQA